MNKIYIGDALKVLQTLPDNSIDCCVSSPPYFNLRDYGVNGQIGLEKTPEVYIHRLVGVFNEVYRVIKPSGTLWLNIGDSYNGSGKSNGCELKKYLQSSNPEAQKAKPTHIAGIKSKDLIGVPWMLAFALRSSGWYLRQEIIWHKPNPMPESVRDRCTKSHESLFLFTKSHKYYFDHEAIMEPAKYDGRKNLIKQGSPKYASGEHGAMVQSFAKKPHSRWPNMIGNVPMRNKRDVWTIATRPFKGAHFATFPPDLIKPCILAGCPVNGIVLDPFFGSGTTGLVAQQLGRNYIGIDLNAEYGKIAEERIQKDYPFEYKRAS